jgi:hypothetical protein
MAEFTVLRGTCQAFPIAFSLVEAGAMLRFAMAIFSGLLFAACLAPAVAGQEEPPEIRVLIDQLDSDSFTERESAVKRLAAAGLDAVPWLAREIVAGSPEATMRSVRIIEQIAIGADESGMTRIAAIFQYLANNGFPHLAEQAKIAFGGLETEPA